MRTGKQRKAAPTNSAVQRHVYVHVLLVQHLCSVISKYMVWYGPTLKIS